MAIFRYFAATADNEIRNGIIEAESAQDASSSLRDRGLFVIRIGRPSRLSSLWTVLNREIALTSPLRAVDLARLSQEWGELVEAGISIEESLALLGSIRRSSTQRALLAVRDAVKEGLSLHEALSRFPGLFPPMYRSLIQAGETSGSLGSTIRRLGDDLMARRALIEEVRNALLYPLFLLITASTGILVLLLIVVPNLENLMGEGGEERLPTVTRIVLIISHILQDYGAGLLSVSIILVIAAVLVILTPTGRVRLDAIVLKIPVCGPLVGIIETGRFTRSLGTLLKGGVTVSAAMLIALQTVANRRMQMALESAHRSIVSGAAIGDAIAASNVLQNDAIGLIRVGERTGRLSDALERIAILYEARATTAKSADHSADSLLTIGFGAIAGMIVYAMLSTILGINELAGQ